MLYVICNCNFLQSSSPYNDQAPSCSQRKEPPSCNLQGPLPLGIVGQGGPLCRICTWFNICTFWSYCIFLNSHPVSQHPKRSFWSSQFWPPAGGVNIRMGQTFETSYYYNIKRSLWQISSKSEEDKPSPDKWAKEGCYIHKTCSRFHLGWPLSSTSSWFTTIMILIKQSYDFDLNPSVCACNAPMFSSPTYNQIDKDLERTWVGQLDDVPPVEALVAMLTLGFFCSLLSTGNASCLAQQKKVKKNEIKKTFQKSPTWQASKLAKLFSLPRQPP